MQSRIESKNLLLLQAAGNLLRGLLHLFMCCGQQLLLAAVLILCSGSSGVLIGCAAGRSSDDSSAMGSFTSLRTVQKYSESAREIMLERYGDDHPAASWPIQGSIEYYELLRNQDGARLAAAASGSRRHLLRTTSTTTAYTSVEGKDTEQYGNFFYAFIKIGTPSVEYFVALDTTSDLLWVPCECQQCAPLSSPGTADTSNSIGNTYSPSSSSTSQGVNCRNPLCSIDQTTCAAASHDGSQQESCPYTESNFYFDTNSSGFLVEDNLSFMEYGGKPVSVPIVFGCGQTQTGYFLNGVLGLDGVLGLGTGEISVPSTLSRELGLLDSFSICTNFSGTGRIAFGDNGTSTQQTTPFVSNSRQENLVQITELEVGNKSIPAGLNASFDTLVYYTYLPSAVYTEFVNTYSSLVTFPKANIPADLELCYETTNQSIEIPNLSFIFPNGETFMSVAFLAFKYENQTGFCLGIQNSTLPKIIIGCEYFRPTYLRVVIAFFLRSTSLFVYAIIGHVFWIGGLLFGCSVISMYGYSFTFNQEDKLVGWIPSTCYNDITTSAPAPAPIFAPISTPPLPTPPSSAPTSPSSASLSPQLSPLTGPPTAPSPSASVMEFVLPSPIITLSLLGFLLCLSLL